MASLDQLPPEVLVHIFSYLYQNKRKDVSYRYHLDNNHLNLVNKRFQSVIDENKDYLLIHEPTHVLGYYWAKNLIH